MTSFVDEYVAYAHEFCDAPDTFHKFNALLSLSSVVGTNVGMRWGRGFVYPNLWVLFVAESGSRKSFAMKIGSELLTTAGGQTIFPNEFSKEKLVGLLGARSGGSFHLSEFSQFMGVLRSGYNDGVLGFLTDIYDVPQEYVRSLKSTEIRLTRPCVTIAACTTPDFMNANEDEWASGFGPRFLLVPGARDRHLFPPPTPDPEKERRLVRFLRRASKVRGRAVFENLDYIRCWATRNDEQLRAKPAIERSTGVRLEAYVVKLSMLFQVSMMEELFKGGESHPGYEAPDEREDFVLAPDPLPEEVFLVSDKAVQAAISLAQWVSERQMEAYDRSSINSSAYSKMQNKVLEGIAALLPNATRTQLLKRTRISAKRLDELVETLREADALEVKTRKTGKGRTIKYYELIDEDAREAAAEREAIQEEGAAQQNNGQPSAPKPESEDYTPPPI